MFANVGYPRGMVRDNTFQSNKNLISIFILATITFAGVYFAYYAVTFVDDNVRINFFFKGVHISEYKSNRIDISNFKDYHIDKLKKVLEENINA